VDHPHVGVDVVHLRGDLLEVRAVDPLVARGDLARVALQPVVNVFGDLEEGLAGREHVPACVHADRLEQGDEGAQDLGDAATGGRGVDVHDAATVQGGSEVGNLAA
jgi:hypothetical protein